MVRISRVASTAYVNHSSQRISQVNSMDVTRRYLAACARTHSLPSTSERSFSGTLERLLGDVGEDLTPPVTCVMELQNQGKGHPEQGASRARGIPSKGHPDVQ